MASSRTTGSETAGMVVKEWPFVSPDRLFALFLAMARYLPSELGFGPG